MSKFVIVGGKPLNGILRASGNKNAVLPIMAATLLIDGEVELTNVPKISDVLTMGKILSGMGCKVEGLGTGKLRIDARAAVNPIPKEELVAKLRASILLLGPLFSRFGRAEIRHPGGCIIGRRPVGTHIEALEAMGAKFRFVEDWYVGKGKLRAANIFLGEASVTATENAITAAVKTVGETVISNAACEPHIVCLAEFLNKAGAKISGAGTNTIAVEGVKKLRPVSFRVRPDHIEVGSFAVATAVTGGDVVITDVEPVDLHMILTALGRFGVNVFLEKMEKASLGETGWQLHVKPSKLHSTDKILAGLWPAFPTDLMSVFIVLASQAKGATLCHDPLYEGRMFFAERLVTMGANITICDPHRVLVFGPTKLRGKKLDSPDLRAGVALVIAALSTSEESEIEKIELVERGYEELDKRLSGLGAKMKKIES